MKVLLAKLLCLVGVFVLMLGGSLLPVKVLQADHEKARRSQRLLSLCNAFGGGVFLATCFNALLPAVRHKFQEVSQQLGHVATDYPVAETLMVAGFFLTVFVEQLVLTCRKERPSFIDLETFNAGSDVGSSDSEHESPFLEHSWGHGHGPLHGEHGHPDLSVQELSRSGPLRLASLVLALSAHSVFEGLALGLPGLFLEGAWLSQNVCVTYLFKDREREKERESFLEAWALNGFLPQTFCSQVG